MSDLKIDVCAMACMKAELSARVRELEAAVRWQVKTNRFNAEATADCPHKATDFDTEDWIAAHPIVRSVIEEGGE